MSSSRTKVSLLFSLIVALSTMGLAGCGHYTCGVTFGGSCAASGSGIGGSTGTGSATAAFVYAVDTNGTIDGYTLNTTANTFSANATTGPTIPTNDTGVGMVVAQKQFLYAAFRNTTQIYGWTIDSTTGDLTAISDSPYSAPFLAFSNEVAGEQIMIVNPAGTYLFVADSVENMIYAYQIGTGGALTAVSGSPFTTLSFSPTNLTTDGLGNYLFATNGNSSTHTGTEVAAFGINSFGALTAVSGSPFSFPMWQVQGEPSGAYLIGTTGKSVLYTSTDDSTLHVFSISQADANAGALTEITGSPFTTSTSPLTIAVQPNSGGTLVYGFGIEDSGLGYNPIEGYAINDSTGALTAVTGSPFSNISSGYWGQFDQSGTFLFPYSSVEDSSTGIVVNQLGALAVPSGGDLTQPVSPITLTTAGYWTVTDPQ